MASGSVSTADIDKDSSEETAPINFTVKTSKDEKYTLSLPATTPVSELKTKLQELSQITPELQRLIYSGRVMKDEETLQFYKVQSGHTVHLVKGAASNQRAAAGSTAGSSTQSGAPGVPRVPRNIAAGAGNNPLAGLTGARYAGLAPLPNPNIFGPDGGMGPPPDADQMYTMMNNPGFQATMNEMLQNPQMLDYIIESNPQLRQIPGAREMMQSPEFRQMITNPEMIRQATVFQRQFGLRGGGAQPSFPAPGITDTTPVPPGTQPQQPQQPQQSQPQQEEQGQPQAGSPSPFNPFAANPFAALFGAPPSASGQPVQPPLADNPYASLANFFGAPPAYQQSSAGNQEGTSPPGSTPGQPTLPNIDWGAMSEMLRQAYGTNPGAAPPGAGGLGIPPYLLGMLGGLGGPPSAGSPPPPVDNRPPEERYAEQLRQLNEMGFYNFDRNIEALRRSGGSVQGAIQHLLGD